MAPNELAKLVEECESLQRTVHDLNVQARSVEQRLAALSAKCVENARDDRVHIEVPNAVLDAMIPSIREAIREELRATRQLDEAWYEPSEVAAMSCGRVTAETVRNWFRWGQINGESDGRQVRLYQSTVEELRKNKWRPLREPDPSKMPPSHRPRRTRNDPESGM